MKVLPAALLAALALGLTLAFPFAAPAQEHPPGVGVERVTLRPGESATFTLAQGYSHQLLRQAAPTAAGAITVRYEVAGGASTISAVSRTGYPTRFSVLADPDGNGGFSPMGEIALPGDGTTASRSWPGALGAVNVGNFVGGPEGGAPRPPGR